MQLIISHFLLSQVNSDSLSALRSSSWHRQDSLTIPYPVTFADVALEGGLSATHLDHIDLVSWRDTYLSLGRDQEVTGQFTFQGGLTLNTGLEVEDVYVGDTDGNEGTINTPYTSHKFSERYFGVNLLNFNLNLF